jgi:hypothetical protein
MADGEKQEAATIHSQLAHCCWDCTLSGKQQISFAFPFLRIKQTHRHSVLESADCGFNFFVHEPPPAAGVHQWSYAKS